MSQLDDAVAALQADHPVFIAKATDVYDLIVPKNTNARDAATRTQTARDNAHGARAGAEGYRDEAATASTSAMGQRQQASDANQAALAARDSCNNATTRARQAAMRTEAIEAGDVSRYTDWLTSSPASQDTLVFAFGDVRPSDQDTLIFDFETQTYRVWETESDFRFYE